MSEFKRKYLIHPGEILKDELEELNISQNRLAMEIRVPAARVNDIIRGKRGITPDTALRLAKFFNTSMEFWMNLQAAYDKKVVGAELKDELEKIHPLTLSVAAHA